MKYADSYKQLAKFGRELLDGASLEQGLIVINNYLKDVIKAERCTIFIYNKKLNLLWSVIADGSRKIIINSDEGVVGDCINSARSVISNDPYNDERFFADLDIKNDFTTKNLAVVPIFSSSKDTLGALELLNKPEGFDEEDLKFMKFFCGYISSYIEHALLYDDDTKYLFENRFKVT